MSKAGCAIGECDRISHALTYCRLHYKRLKAHGDVNWLPWVPGRPCKVDGCGNPMKSKALCVAHYYRLLKHGDPLAGGTMIVKGGPDARFLVKFKAGAIDDCWEWTGASHDFGYGSFRYNKIGVSAHRYSYEYYVGPIPEGMHVRHKCDNPPCVNPNHLELGTNQQNIQDAVNRGRSGRPWVKLDANRLAAVKAELARPDRRFYREIAEEYGVSQSLIWKIANGQCRTIPTTERRLAA